MPEPITIGALVAAALAAGAAETGKSVLGKAAGDAYGKLKSLATHLIGAPVAQLEARPDSDARAAVVAELIEEQPDETRAQLRLLADALRAALTAEGRGSTMDNRITVIASGRNAIAAGGDVNIGVTPRGES